jgi:hypothetical protein
VKVLLDENLDHRFRKVFAPHDVWTVAFLGLAGVKNGKLLDAAETQGFEVLVTGDQSLPFEQNLMGRKLAILAMSAVEYRIVLPNAQKLLDALEVIRPGELVRVECGGFRRGPDRARGRALNEMTDTLKTATDTGQFWGTVS